MGLFAKIKNALKKTKDAIAYKLNKLFTGGVLNDDFYDELESILLSADIGSETTEQILEALKAHNFAGGRARGVEAHNAQHS